MVVLQASSTAATLRVGARLPLVLERRMSLDPERPVLRLEETVSNCADAPTPFLWGHHPAFAAKVGMRIDLPPGPIHLASTTRRERHRLAAPARQLAGYLRDR